MVGKEFDVFILFTEQVNVNLKIPGKKLEHHGVKIEFIGQIGKERHSTLHILSLLKSLLTSSLCVSV